MITLVIYLFKKEKIKKYNFFNSHCLVTPSLAHNIFSNLLHIPTHGMAFNLVRDHY